MLYRVLQYSGMEIFETLCTWWCSVVVVLINRFSLATRAIDPSWSAATNVYPLPIRLGIMPLYFTARDLAKNNKEECTRKEKSFRFEGEMDQHQSG